MPKIMWKSLHLCFPSSFIKCYSAPCLPPSSAANDDPDLPSRPSFLLINNFNLLYPDNVHHRVACSGGRLVDLPSSSTTTTAGATSSSSTSFESDHYEISLDSPQPDFSAAFASRRFFVSSPGRSNAITDSPETRSSEISDNYENAPFTTKINYESAPFAAKINYETAPFATKINYENAPFAAKINCDNAVTTTKENYDTTPTTKLLSDGTAVKQCVYSPDPFTDFRQSMQEMIDAAIDAGDINRPADGYDFLHELLLSYLSLNPIDTHKFVIRAFTDIMVSLLSNERRIC